MIINNAARWLGRFSKRMDSVASADPGSSRPGASAGRNRRNGPRVKATRGQNRRTKARCALKHSLSSGAEPP